MYPGSGPIPGVPTLHRTPFSTDWETKVWGRVCHSFFHPHLGLSYLEVDAGFRCSIHYHAARNNEFRVLSGMIVVEEWWPKDEYDPTLGPPSFCAVLCKGGVHKVAANIIHRFRVLDTGIVLEIYTPSTTDSVVEMDDIVRLNEGGKDE